MTKSKRKTLKVKQSGADLSSGPRSQIQRSELLSGVNLLKHIQVALQIEDF